MFLLGGHRGGEVDANVLMRSTDGYKWEAQGVGPVIYTDNLVFDWDEKRFYAGGPSATGACAIHPMEFTGSFPAHTLKRIARASCRVSPTVCTVTTTPTIC